MNHTVTFPVEFTKSKILGHIVEQDDGRALLNDCLNAMMATVERLSGDAYDRTHQARCIVMHALAHWDEVADKAEEWYESLNEGNE